MQEIEIKLKIPNETARHAIEGRCRLHAADSTEMSQRDEYFDSVDGQLKNADLTVRIRGIQSGSLVALKGPRIHQPNGVYERIELEFEVVETDKIRSRLEKQGLSPTVVIEKHRVEFRVRDCNVAIDTLPFIGSFVEIEGPSVESIEATRVILNLESLESITRNYTELLEDHLQAAGRQVKPQLIATFPEE